MYGSSLMLVTRMPRDSRIAARDAAAIPFPREETTPPVTKTYLVIYLTRVGMDESTGTRSPPQTRGGLDFGPMADALAPRYGLRCLNLPTRTPQCVNFSSRQPQRSPAQPPHRPSKSRRSAAKAPCRPRPAKALPRASSPSPLQSRPSTRPNAP